MKAVQHENGGRPCFRGTSDRRLLASPEMVKTWLSHEMVIVASDRRATVANQETNFASRTNTFKRPYLLRMGQSETFITLSERIFRVAEATGELPAYAYQGDFVAI